MLELKSKNHRVTFSKLGAKLVSFFVDGVDVVAGPGSDADALASDFFSGTVTGRYAGRITGSKFTLDGKVINLLPNIGPDHLHGGPKSFCNSLWKSPRCRRACVFRYIRPMATRVIPAPWR
jgi:aldose 1-epimerase